MDRDRDLRGAGRGKEDRDPEQPRRQCRPPSPSARGSCGFRRGCWRCALAGGDGTAREDVRRRKPALTSMAGMSRRRSCFISDLGRRIGSQRGTFGEAPRRKPFRRWARLPTAKCPSTSSRQVWSVRRIWLRLKKGAQQRRISWRMWSRFCGWWRRAICLALHQPPAAERKSF